MTTGSVPYIYQPREFSAPDHERLAEIVRGELNVIADILNSGEAVFAPEEHGHDWGDLSNVPAFASRWPSWSEVTSKPSTFPPSAHTHAKADITDFEHAHGLEDLTGFGDAGGYISSNGSAWVRVSGVAWGDLTGVPSTFAPSAHTHGDADITALAWSKLTDLPAYATRWPAWSEVTSKPSVFPPDTHSHAISDITGLQTALDGKEPGLGNPAADGYVLASTAAGVRSWVAMSGGVSDHGALSGLGDDDHTQYYNETRGDARYRQLSAAVPWADLSGLPAFATRWPSWSEVTDKPATFLPLTAHSPDQASSLGEGFDLNTLQESGDYGFYYQSSNASATSGSNYPVAQAGSLLVQRAATTGGVGATQLYQTYHASTPELFFRSAYGAWSSWRKVWHDGNFDPASKANDSDVAKLNANNIFTAGATGANGNTFSADLPGFWLVETDQAADGQQWRVSVNGGLFNISTFSDDRSTSAQAFAAQRSGNTVTSARMYAAGSIQLTSQNHAASTATTGAQVRHSDGNLYDVGMNIMPPVASNGATRTVLAVGDNGRATIFTGSTSTWTTSTGASAGYVMNGLNAGSGNITLNAGSGQTIYWFTGAGLTTGSRTISPGGVFTLWARTATVLYLWGSGIS